MLLFIMEDQSVVHIWSRMLFLLRRLASKCEYANGFSDSGMDKCFIPPQLWKREELIHVVLAVFRWISS